MLKLKDLQKRFQSSVYSNETLMQEILDDYNYKILVNQDMDDRYAWFSNENWIYHTFINGDYTW